MERNSCTQWCSAEWIIEEANEDLDSLAAILEQQDVKVNRPSTALDFQGLGGMYNYCPRDRFLIAGREILRSSNDVSL